MRAMSEAMFDLGDARRADWGQMRPYVLPLLGPQGHEVLVAAEGSSDRFEAFFESFARAARPTGLH
ncbi:DUF6902 family protein [Sulfitobacter aestuariivivens]|uniref:DUF6902 family protein n=1 Tax=Sulfitobacter aestuariivivens TaxID=2766981 RepID=UPI003611E6BE